MEPDEYNVDENAVRFCVYGTADFEILQNCDVYWSGRRSWRVSVAAAHHDAVQLAIAANMIPKGIRTGDSVAINGCCLTVTAHRKDQLFLTCWMKRSSAPISENSVRAHRKPGARHGGGWPLGGHFVQGHVDGVGTVKDLLERRGDLRIEITIPEGFSQYIAYKGSIGVNGVSLTVAEVNDETFAVWIIPHTRAHTNLSAIETGDAVNLEFDILAKYAERILNGRRE